MGKWEVWQDQKQASIAQGRRRHLRQQAEQLRAEREAAKADASPADGGTSGAGQLPEELA